MLQNSCSFRLFLNSKENYDCVLYLDKRQNIGSGSDMGYQTKNKKIFWAGTEPSTNNHLIDCKSIQSGIELLRYIVLVWGYIATPVGLYWTHFTKQLWTFGLQEKREQKAVPKDSNDFKPEIRVRALAHAGIEPATPHRILVSVTTAPSAGPISGTTAQILLIEL